MLIKIYILYMDLRVYTLTIKYVNYTAIRMGVTRYARVISGMLVGGSRNV